MNSWIVKLGGSLANSAELPQWLDVIATAGAGKVVLVPGGGPWADEVRVAQEREGFDDTVAHRKALRAMEQYARVLAGMRPILTPAFSVEQIHEILGNGLVAVWMPHDMVVADPSIPESWDVTSDSLSAWLAKRLNAFALLLVKSVNIAGALPRIEELVNRGWVDPAFAEFISDTSLQIVLLGPGDQKIAQRMLTEISDTVASNHG